MVIMKDRIWSVTHAIKHVKIVKEMEHQIVVKNATKTFIYYSILPHLLLELVYQNVPLVTLLQQLLSYVLLVILLVWIVLVHFLLLVKLAKLEPIYWVDPVWLIVELIMANLQIMIQILVIIVLLIVPLVFQHLLNNVWLVKLTTYFTIHNASQNALLDFMEMLIKFVRLVVIFV